MVFLPQSLKHYMLKRRLHVGQYFLHQELLGGVGAALATGAAGATGAVGATGAT